MALPGPSSGQKQISKTKIESKFQKIEKSKNQNKNILKNDFIRDFLQEGFQDLITFDTSDDIGTFVFSPNKAASASFIKLAKFSEK